MFDSHLKKKSNNLDAYSCLNLKNPQFIDWEIVTVFYAALHLIDAYFAKNNIHPTDHTDRRHLINNNTNLDPIRNDYKYLYLLSKTARYDRAVMSQKEIQSAITWLSNIEKAIQPLLL
jgi:hypothetical protein